MYIIYNNHDFKISRISVVDVLLDTASSGPMMVYALTLNVTTVLRGYGGHSVYAVWLHDVLL